MFNVTWKLRLENLKIGMNWMNYWWIMYKRWMNLYMLNYDFEEYKIIILLMYWGLMEGLWNWIEWIGWEMCGSILQVISYWSWLIFGKDLISELVWFWNNLILEMIWMTERCLVWWLGPLKGDKSPSFKGDVAEILMKIGGFVRSGYLERFRFLRIL